MNLNNEFGNIAKSGAKVGIIFGNSNTYIAICDNDILAINGLGANRPIMDVKTSWNRCLN